MGYKYSIIFAGVGLRPKIIFKGSCQLSNLNFTEGTLKLLYEMLLSLRGVRIKRKASSKLKEYLAKFLLCHQWIYETAVESHC